MIVVEAIANDQVAGCTIDFLVGSLSMCVKRPVISTSKLVQTRRNDKSLVWKWKWTTNRIVIVQIPIETAMRLENHEMIDIR